MKNYWKKLGTQTLFEHPRLTVVEDEVELPNGKQTKYMRHEGLEDYVTVIALKEGSILLLKEYSYPHDEWLWQFPEGGVEANENPEEAAQRELQEEADMGSAKIEQIGMNYDHHRRTTRKNYIYTAQDLHDVANVTGDEEEAGIQKAWFTIEQVNNMIQKGEILQKNTLAAWSLFLADRNNDTQK